MEKHPLQIKIPELQKSPEAEKAVKKKERLEDIELPNSPNERIDAYMDRLENVFLNPDEEKRERNIEMLKPAMYDRYIIKPEQVPESYFELQKQVARERGIAVEEISENIKRQMIEVVIKDQKHSLDAWIEYLTSPDAMYPTWFKYFVVRNVLKLSQFDKSLGKFKSRTETTVAPYPDIYREPLAKICDIYEEAIKSGKPQNDPEFTKSFPKLYAELITESLASKIESNEEIRGEWIKYEQGNSQDAQKLFESLDGKGTGWCTAGHSTAETQIQSGDFYVYYTFDKNNEPTQPRIAIRMDGQDKIGEVRGVLEHQALESQMTGILEEKLKEFGPEADQYKKKVEDMRRMTEIERKIKSNQELTREDLVFLYEIDSSIEGFGYDRDPRIEEILENRDTGVDYPIIFDCKIEEIVVGNPDLINENTKLYNFGGEHIDYKVLPKLRPDMKVYAELPNKPIEFIKPQSLNYHELSKERSGRQTRILNPDMMEVDLEKAKVFIPDLSRFKGKPRYEVMQYVVETYGDKYISPGLEYQDYVIKNPDKFPQFKDGNFYFFPGSIFRGSYGIWYVPYSSWGGGRFYRNDGWLGDGWYSSYRLVLLEI